MKDIETIANLLITNWSNKTLEELRVEAEIEATGICFESIRAESGQRFIVVLCLTDIDQIARIEKTLDLVDDGIKEAWNTLTLAEIVMRTMRGDGFSYESVQDEFGRRSALALIATNPRSMKILETLFNLPK